MKTSKIRSRLVAVCVGLFLSAIAQNSSALVTKEWQGASGADPNVATNWVGNVAVTAAEEARFTDLNGTSPLTVTIPSGGWNPLYIGFSGKGVPPGTFPAPTNNGGVLATIPNYTFDGPGTITIASNGNIDTGWGNTGTVTFNNTGGVDLVRGASLYAGASGGSSNLVIGANTPIRFGVSSTSNSTATINAVGANVTINPVVDWTASAASSRQLQLRAQSGKTVTLVNGVLTTGSKLSTVTINSYDGLAPTGPNGVISLGGNGIASDTAWAGAMNIRYADVIIYSGTALGDPGSLSSVTGYTEPYPGSSGTGALILSNAVNPGGFNSGESIFLGHRANDTLPDIINQSGHNILSGNIGADGDNSPSQANRTYTLEARGAVGTDIFELSGLIQKTSFAAGAGTLVLKGTGSGLVSGTISSDVVASGSASQDGGTWGVTKKGSGTWTFTNNNTYTGPTSIQEGTLELSGAGAINSTSGVSVKSGSFFKVSGLAGGFTLNALQPFGGPQSLSGAGTVTGSVTSAGGSISPGDSGVGTLSISNALTLNSGTVSLELTNVPTSSSGVNDKIVVGTNLTLSGTVEVPLTLVNGGLASGTYTLMSYGGALTGGLGNLHITGTPNSPRQTFVPTLASGQVNLVVGGGAASLTWVGGVNGNIWADGQVVSNSINWTGGGADNHFYDGDSVTFSNSGTTRTPNISGTVRPNGITFTNGAGIDYTVSGDTIESVGTTTLSNNGKVTFSNISTTVSNLAMTGAGLVEVTAGNFAVINSASLDGSGTLRFSNSFNMLTLPTTVALNSGTLSFNRSDELVDAAKITSNIGGAGAIQKLNTNTVELSGDNSTYTGTATVEAGRLRIAGATTLTNTVVQNNAVLEFNSGATGVAVPGGGTRAISIVGNGLGEGALVLRPTTSVADINAHIGNLTLAGNAMIAATNVGGQSGRSILWVDGLINGNGHDLVVNVDIAASLASPNEIDFINNGAINVNKLTVIGGGALYIGKNTDLGSTGKVVLGDGSTNGTLGIYLGTDPSATTLPVNKPIEVAENSIGSIQTYHDAAAVVNSTVTVSGTRLEVLNYPRADGTTSVEFKGKITGPGGLASHASSSGNARLGNVILTSDLNDFAGPIQIGGGGDINNTAAGIDRASLSIGNGGATGSIGPGDITITPSNVVSALNLNRTGTYSLPNNIALNTNANSRIQAIGAGNVTLSGAISGFGRVIMNNPNGSLTLSGDNSYTGASTNVGITLAAAGHIILAHNNALGQPGTNNAGYVETWGPTVGGGDDTAAILLTNNITVNKTSVLLSPHSTNGENVGPQLINVSGNNELIGTIESDAVPSGNVKYVTIQSNAGSNLKITGEIRQGFTGIETLTFRGAGDGEVNGPISQPTTNFYNGAAVSDNVWNVVKEGTGHWTFTGPSSYTGNTFVNGGILSIDNAYLADSSDVILKTGGKFNLNFGDSDVIDSLIIDNMPAAVGIWGGPGTGADHISNLLGGTGTLTVSSLATLDGDYNHNGFVDAADYVLWRKNPNTYGGDPDGYDLWRQHFGESFGSGSGSGAGELGGSVGVPEPSTLLLCGLAMLGSMATARSRRERCLRG